MMGTIRSPIVAQCVQASVREKRIPVFVSFSSFDEHAHGLGIDVRCLDRGHLAHPQSGTIDEHEHGSLFEVVTVLQDGRDLLAREHFRKGFVLFLAGNLQVVQGAVQGDGKEETNGRVIHVHRRGRCFFLVDQVG